ncbi:hypothetical protein JVT61DRAFT_402 [Boletus reticuloceps]|uniref:Uncharacterized protein n=1 Tax=Boletus reticuloceps TaxID=495285 RepID=A0A8I2Z146_9AGAM|nr:hypothetical protein JVT61DRAFT_402 [Boletus reticuloceps]
MCAHRDFLYKRAHLAVRATPSPSTLGGSLGDKIPDTPAPPLRLLIVRLLYIVLTSPFLTTAIAKTVPSDPLTSAASKPTDTPRPSSSSPAPSSLSTPATSSTLSSSSSLISASSSTLPSSSDTHTTHSTPVSTPLTVASSTPVNAPPVKTTQAFPSVMLTPTTSALSPSATPSAVSSSGAKTSTIVGGVAGTLVAIAALGLLLMWCMRRQRSRDIDDFDAQAFKRQSAILVDDPPAPSRSYNPRPPTMIEQHNASPALAAQGAYSGQNFYGNYSEHSQQPPYAPEMNQLAGSPPPRAYGAPSMGYAGYNDPQQRIVRQPSNMGRPAYDPTQQLARQPSNAQYLTRQPSSAPGYSPPTAPPTSLDPNARYIDLNRSSISPYQAAQYADISRQLGTNNPNSQVPHESFDSLEGPLPSPFDDPAQGTSMPDASSSTRLDPTPFGLAIAAPSPQPQGNTTLPHQRPVTLYEEGDAYGGI